MGCKYRSVRQKMTSKSLCLWAEVGCSIGFTRFEGLDQCPFSVFLSKCLSHPQLPQGRMAFLFIYAGKACFSWYPWSCWIDPISCQNYGLLAGTSRWLVCGGRLRAHPPLGLDPRYCIFKCWVAASQVCKAHQFLGLWERASQYFKFEFEWCMFAHHFHPFLKVHFW